MKITKIVKQNNSNERYNIYVDDEYAFSATLEDILKYSIKIDIEITKEQLDTLIEYCEENKCYNYALFLLSKKDYTQYEITKKLTSKGYSKDVINKIIDKLKRYDIINDEKYAKKYINECLNIKKYGIKKIEYNLLAKGIELDSIENVSCDYDIQLKTAIELIQKKIKYYKNNKDIKNKLIRYLIYRGFEYDIVKEALKSIKLEDDGENI